MKVAEAINTTTGELHNVINVQSTRKGDLNDITVNLLIMSNDPNENRNPKYIDVKEVTEAFDSIMMYLLLDHRVPAFNLNHEKLYINSIYKHFKGKLYMPLDIVYNITDKAFYVLYTALYNNNELYLRPLNEFLSKVDVEKYPNVKQEYRFEPLNHISVREYFISNRKPFSYSPFHFISIPKEGMRADLFLKEMFKQGMDLTGDTFYPLGSDNTIQYVVPNILNYDMDENHIVKLGKKQSIEINSLSKDS